MKDQKVRQIKSSKKTKPSESKKTRDIIANQYEDVPLLFLDPEDFDKTIIGVAEGYNFGPTVAYDYDKIIEENMKDGGTIEDAEEYFNFNQIGAYVGKHTPIFIKTTKTLKGEVR